MRVDPNLRVIVISGGTASGKSALARALYFALDDEWHLLQGDDFIGPAFKELAGRGPWDPDGRMICRRMLNDAAKSWMERVRVSLLVEGFFKESREIDDILAATETSVDEGSARILHLVVSESEARRRRPYENPRTAEVHSRALTCDADEKDLDAAIAWATGALGPCAQEKASSSLTSISRSETSSSRGGSTTDSSPP